MKPFDVIVIGAGHAGVASSVYHVTTTADSGPGSLRAAVNATNRTVVFDVGGTINLTNVLVITNSYITIAGQTAPGGGITVAGQEVRFQSAQHIIIRDVRFRRGAVDDSLMLTNVSAVIADHVSAEWSDTVLSTLNSSNVTVQWSVLADSFYVTNNALPNGSLLRYGNGTLSFHHNLYADNYSGSPRLGDNLTLDFVDNVIYNWGLQPGFSVTNDLVANPNGSTNQLNYVGNYLIAGPDTARYATNLAITNIAFVGSTTNTWIFQTNNLIDANINQILDGGNTDWAMFTNQFTKFGRPFPVLSVPTDEAFLAYERVLDFAGVNLPLRDPVDATIVRKVRNQNGRLISAPPSLPVVLPGMVAWWRAENSYLDSVGANDGSPMNGTGLFGVGEVGTAFNLNAANSYVLVNATPSLNVGLGNGFTIEGWVNPATLAQDQPVVEFERVLGTFSGANVAGDFYVSIVGGQNGKIYANFLDTNGTSHTLSSAVSVMTVGDWQHVAETYDKITGVATLYRNGVIVAQQNLGVFTPQTSFTNFLIGARTTFGSVSSPADKFSGSIDELSVYNRALSSNDIAAIYNAGSAGKTVSSTETYTPTYLDTDQDGIPDFWEATFTTNLLFTPSNNNDRDGDGYTDLEEYNNWLAGPHVLTVTTNPVSVDLLQLCGQTGNLSFSVTNGVYGTVYLTNVIGSVTNTGPYSNSIAVFTPTNNAASATNFSGYAAFDVYVTNNDTIAYFGPVTVSVVASAVPIVMTPPLNIVTLTNGVPYYDPNTGGTDYYRFTVAPLNGTDPVAVLFTVTNCTAPVTLVVNYGLPLPTLYNYNYTTNSWQTGENILVTTSSTPVMLTNGDWYMGVVNVSGGTVDYTVVATAYYNIVPPQFLFPTNTTIITNLETVPLSISCLATDLDTPPLPLTYALVGTPPAGLTLSNNVIYWTPTEAQGPSTNSVLVSVSNGAFSVTNSFIIDVLESNLPPTFTFTNIPNQIVGALNLLTVTNSATDVDIPQNLLTYSLYVASADPTAPAVTNAFISTNGLISWIPTLAQAGTNYLFATVVTDTNPWAVNTQSFSITNYFTVMVPPNLNGGEPKTNIVGTNSINWFTVTVPTNAVFATNWLIFATLPVNVWFSTNVSPTTNYNLIPAATNGVSVLSRNSSPTNIVPGGTYYLGVQNTNTIPVTNAIEVDFLLAQPPVLPVLPLQVITAGDTLVVTNTATDTSPSALVYFLVNAPAGAGIGNNGILTWVTSTNLAPAGYVLTAVVTNSITTLAATNSVNVLVLPALIIDQPQTNIVNAGSTRWFTVKVPTNADFATNQLVSATAPVNFWFSTNLPPSVVNVGDVELLTNSLGGTSVITTNAAPYLVPGTRYYLGVQNTNAFAVTNVVKVKFHLVLPPVVLNFSSIVATNMGGTNGFLLTWYAPAADQFHLWWSPSLLPANWQAFKGVISYSKYLGAASSRFTYFDDGSQTGGFDPNRYYRLQLLDSPTNTAPEFTLAPGNSIAAPHVLFSVTNAARDYDVPAQTLTYAVSGSLAGTNLVSIDTNGVITWTPTVAQGGSTNIITTVVTDNGVPAKTVTNNFTVAVTVFVSAPFAATAPAQLITGTAARLGGFATPNGPSATAWFEWGANTQYGNTTPPVSVGGGNNVVWVTNSISGLTSGVPCHFRLVVSNSVSVARGFDQVFGQGKVIGWGHNGFGQTTVPAVLTNAVAVAAGSFHSMVLKADGTVVAWGYNQFGQTNVPGGLNNVVAMAGGDYHSLALQADGTVAVWGLNGYGLLNIPAGLNNVVAVAAGYYHNLALKADGTVAAWGFDSNGQSDVPAGLNNVVAIAGGLSHSLALKADGTVLVWGDNSSGQTNVPLGLTNVVAVAAGANQNVALKSDGTIVAWGDNFYGETNVPAGITNAVLVTGSSHDSAALKGDGSVVVWGANNLIQTFVPSTVRNAVGLASRGDFSLALVSSNPVNPTNAPAVTNFSIGGLLADTNGIALQWTGTTNQQFEIRWTTNILPPTVWTLFSNNLVPLTVTSTNGTFRFVDTNASLMKFYQLILLP